MTINTLKSLPPEQLQRLYMAMRNDYEVFARTCMAHIVTEVPPFHHTIYQALNKRYLYNGFVVFRGGAKSSLSKSIQNTADLCFGREPFTCLISESVDQASKDLVSVVDEIENNEIINTLFGSLKGRVWNQEEIETSNGCFVNCKGYGSRIRGLKWKNRRITKFILDDYESENNTATTKQRDKVKQWIDAQILPAGEPGVTTYQFFGTIVHPDAHLAMLKNLSQFQSPNGFYIEIPIEKNGVPAWRNRFSMDFIKGKEQDYREKNRLQYFLQEYYHIPSVLGRPVFDISLIKGLNFSFHKEEGVTWLEDYSGKKYGCNVFIGVDPASSVSERADNSIFFVIAMLDDKSIVILDVDVQKISPTLQVKKLFELSKKYLPLRVTIETQGYQLALADMCRERIANNGEDAFSIKEFTSNKSKNNKWLYGLEPHINNGIVSYIKGCPNIDAFLRECVAYNEETREHDDTIDGLFLAILNAYPPAKNFDVDKYLAYRKLTADKNKRMKKPVNWMTV